MSFYKKRKRNIFDPRDPEPFNVSRSKIDLFLECPQCFYLDRRLGISRPSLPPFTLNTAVDKLLKKEFDIHRAKKETHPLIKKYGIDAIPVHHEDLEIWRENFKGIQVLHEPTNLQISGAIDDLWINPAGEYIVVDYKATAKESEVNIDADWQEGYKRQMEVYQWLLRQKGFKVSNTGYFVYVNGKTDRQAFDGKLEFDVKIIPYIGSDAWLPGTLQKIKECLLSEKAPPPSEKCEYCSYRKAAALELQKRVK